MSALYIYMFLLDGVLFSFVIGYKKMIFIKDFLFFMLPYICIFFLIDHFQFLVEPFLQKDMVLELYFLLFYLVIALIFYKNLKLLFVTLSIIAVLFSFNFVTRFMTIEVVTIFKVQYLWQIILIFHIFFISLVLILKWLGYRLNILENLLTIKPKYQRFNFIFILIFLTFSFIQIRYINMEPNQEYFLSWVVILVFSNLFLIVYFVIRNEKQRKIIQSQLLEFQKQKEIIQKTDAFKRDYKGILLSLVSYIEQEKCDEALDYIQKLTQYAEKSLEENIYTEISKITYFPVQGLLLKKVESIRSQGVIVQVTVGNYVNDIGINIFDFLRLLNIVIDNALEAAVESETPFIAIELDCAQSKLMVKVINSVKEGAIDFEKIMRNHYTTKQNHRGRGLHIMNQICSSYHNLSYGVSVKDKFFSIHLSVEL
ncbi:GHKL domain-containing protein [Listeria sp. PSOL-1]|uniref:GHKL domain-containing protein n=1 Tax=Listeria sp. PSOL-1 TaxID=1844999 RepID=UPI0013CF6836|nr:GHKL domain-containing protein [Listeria sp. PSOL-1]